MATEVGWKEGVFQAERESWRQEKKEGLCYNEYNSM